jgi:hypothetical protein
MFTDPVMVWASVIRNHVENEPHAEFLQLAMKHIEVFPSPDR